MAPIKSTLFKAILELKTKKRPSLKKLKSMLGTWIPFCVRLTKFAFHFMLASTAHRDLVAQHKQDTPNL